MRNCLVLVQYREQNNGAYNDFIGKFYHFPGHKDKSYLGQFKELPIEFVYYEPTTKGGKGEYFGYGRIIKEPFEDKRDKGYFFTEIDDYKPFKKPVYWKDSIGCHREYDSSNYNAQNAVRKISSDVLDEICLDGEIQFNFNADAHLIKVLGEQLIASEKVGILELIKNAYDAHATECVIKIEGIPSLLSTSADTYTYPDLKGPVIIIEDNGVGMTKELLEKGWLRPASTIKTNIKEKLKEERKNALINGSLAAYDTILKELKKANRNRIPLGEKGVGRFATHRLGQNLILITKVAQLDYELVLEIDWNKFDKYSDIGIDLHSIGVSLKRQSPSRDYGDTKSGTQLIIYGGREGFEWDEEKMIDLNRSIMLLNSPNPSPKANINNFKAYLKVPQIPHLGNDYIEDHDPTFEFIGLIDEKGVLDYMMTFAPPKWVPMSKTEDSGKIDLLSLNTTYWGDIKHRDGTECGPFYIHINLWYRKKPWVDGPSGQVFLERLSNYGGISIYRDGINIFPAEWGAQNDWLDLSKSHIKQGFKFSYYNMLGNIEIEQGSNIALIDKTNREGLVENKAYKDLRELVKAILHSVVENYWISKRDEYTSLTKDIVRDPKVLNEYVRQAVEINDQIKNNYPIENDPFSLLGVLGSDLHQKEQRLINLTRSLKDLQESLKLMEESQDMLTEQAGFGLAIAASVHEINKITSNFFYGINEVLKKNTFDRNKLEDLRDSSSSLRSELKRLAPLRALRSEKKQEFNIIRPILYAIDVYQSRLKKIGISVFFAKDTGFPVYARYGAVVQVFTNLIDNACYWLDSSSDNNRHIEIKLDEEFRYAIFADNGPGIHESMVPHLFKPGYSMKIPRSGLGLYICKHYMQDMKGDIQPLSNRKYRIANMQGAQFMLDFSKAHES